MFNIVLLILLLTIILVPLYVLGPSFSLSVWRINWPFFAVWVLIFSLFNVFYFTNRQLFFLLEKEDWPVLISYLEGRVIQRGNYSPRLVRLLANSYLVLSDSSAVTSLENKLAIVKPALLNANALVFGTARILENDISGAIRFLETRKATVKNKLKDWVFWYCAFALLLNRQFETAAADFSFLVRESKDGIITALSSYFLSESMTLVLPANEGQFRKISEEGRGRVLEALPTYESYKKEVSRFSTEIHVAFISRYLDESGRWLYGTLDRA